MKLRHELKKNGALFLMALPVTALLLIFNYLPMLGMVLAFKDFNVRDGVWGSPWSGFENFKFLFQTSDAWLITRNTLLYNFAIILLSTLFAVLLAIMLDGLRSKFLSRTFQTVLIMPYFLSWIAVGFIGYAFLNPDKGMINSLLQSFGMEPVLWYSKVEAWPFILIFTAVWKSVGYSSVMYLATITGISKDYYEAAAMDGASKWKQILYITLPFLKPMIIILTLLSIGKIFYADFGLFYHLPRQSGQLYPVTNVIDTYVYNGLKVSGNIGMSAAANFYQSIVGFFLVLGANLTVRKIDPEYSLF
ncbi:MAG: ABC transporter permease subunit [Ruthenibacterium sp.]